MLRTESYIYGNHEFIEAGEIYYFGQLWNGTDGDGKELLESGAVAVYDEEAEYWEVVDFEIVKENNDLLQTEVKVC